jgi:hypothetical protein
MTQKIKLLEKQIELLESLPEQGMGYQLVDIQMEDGTFLNKRTVLNSTFLVLNDSESINLAEIKSIQIYH